MKILKNKFFIILFLMTVFLFFGSITNTLVLNNRGIVVGMGLDEKDGEIQISCQILVAGNMGTDTANNDNYAVLSSFGKTFGEATQKMMMDSAEFMSFAHCNTIIAGKNIVENGRLFGVLDELLKNSKLTEDTYLVYYSGDVQEILKQKVGINLSTSFALQRMMGSADESAGVVKCSIHDYLTGVKDKGIAVLPEVVVERKIDEPTTSNEQKGDDKVILSLRQGVGVSEDELVSALSIEEVGYYNLVEKDFKKGVFAVSVDGKERSVEFRDKSVKLSFGEDYTAKIEIKASLVESNYIVSTKGSDKGEREKVEKKIGDRLRGGVTGLWQKFYEKGYDIFSLRDGFLKEYGEKKTREMEKEKGKITLKVKVEGKITT